MPQWRVEGVGGIAIKPDWGRVAPARVELPSGRAVVFASIHTDTVVDKATRMAVKNDAIFRVLDERFGGGEYVIGGDLNSCRLAEGWGTGWYGHLDFFESLPSRGLRSCTWDLHRVECQTYFKRGKPQAFQDDHVIVSTDPGPRIVTAVVADPTGYVDLEDHRAICSDHLPLVVDLSFD